MLGSIVGDLIGSIYSKENVRYRDFELIKEESHFTKNTAITLGIATSLLYRKGIVESLSELIEKFHEYEYDPKFVNWVNTGGKTPIYTSSNEAAMFICPAGWLINSFELILSESKRYAELTHSHPAGVVGTQVMGLSIYLCRSGISKKDLVEVLERKFGYNFNFSMDDLTKNYSYDPDCEKCLPQIIFTFLDSVDFEDSLRKAVSLGGDSSTIAAINGALAEAFYKEIPEDLKQQALKRMDESTRMLYGRFRVFERRI